MYGRTPIGPDLEAAARVVPLVEVDDACGADVIDLLAGVERRDADRERMHHHRPGEGVVTAGMSAFHTAGLVLFAAVAASVGADYRDRVAQLLQLG